MSLGFLQVFVPVLYNISLVSSTLGLVKMNILNGPRRTFLTQRMCLVIALRSRTIRPLTTGSGEVHGVVEKKVPVGCLATILGANI
jgi:hypothetical protein